MKLAQLKTKKPVDVAFEHEGETLNLVVDANLLTQDFVEKMNAAVGTEDKEPGSLSSAVVNLRFMSETLSRAVISWDLIGEDGQILKPEIELFRALPQSVLSGLFTAVMGAGVPKPPTAETSEDGSLQAVN